MSPVALVLYAAVAVAVVSAAYRLDQRRNETNRGLWHLIGTWFARRGRGAHAGSGEPGSNRRAAMLAALVPLGVVAAVAATALFLMLGDADADGDGAGSAVGADGAEGADGGAGGPLALDTAEATTATRTAVALSRQAFPDGAENVVLTRRSPSVDNLVAGGMVGLLDGPLLLTDPDGLSAETAEEIDRLGTPEVHILGGPAAVDEQIETDLAAAGHSIHRHAGPTGADTAVDIAARHFPDADTAVIAPSFGTGGNSDALVQAMTAGGLAAARDAPVLTSERDALSAPTAAYLQESAITSVLVVGGPEHLGAQVVADLEALGLSTTRYGGTDRFATAAAVADDPVWSTSGAEGTVLLVEGTGDRIWPGIAVAAVYAGRMDAPPLLTDDGQLPPATAQQLRSQVSGTQVLCVVGVSEEVCTQARQLISGA